MQTEYHAALLHLRRQALVFAEAFAEAAQAARMLDPGGGQADPLAQKTMVEITAALQAVCELPGAAEVFALALAAQQQKES